jgi:outer membrane protein OmpA-like peptidoglycan-associated protein
MTSSSTLRDMPSAFRSLYVPVALFLAGLCAVLWISGFGPGGRACTAPLPAATNAAPATAAALAVTPPAKPAPAAPAAAPPPTEKLYFAVNSIDVSAEGRAKLDTIVAYLKAQPGAKAVLSGYHDPRGNRASNEELALNRARATRDALQAAGIANDRVEMAKPAETAGGGLDAEARRVEVSVRP